MLERKRRDIEDNGIMVYAIPSLRGPGPILTDSNSEEYIGGRARQYSSSASIEAPVIPFREKDKSRSERLDSRV
jgi:hypothetical protein